MPNCIVHVEQVSYFLKEKQYISKKFRLFQFFQSGRVDFEGMVDNYSITEITKASLHGLEEMLADVMKIEKETG